VAAFTYAGRLFRADLVRGDVVEVATAVPVTDPRPDPTGQRIAYVGVDAGTDRSTLRVVGPDGTDVLLAGETDGRSRVSWGIAEFVAARRFGRTRGYWWAPDGRSVLAARVDESRVPRWHLHDPAEPSRAPARVGRTRAGGANARVSLHLLDLDGGWVDVHWDRESYPYLVGVRWADGGPLITVLRRPQQHGLVLLVDPRTGETQVHAELADPRWVEPVDGTPRHLPDGRVLVGGELAHEGFDARCLFADGSLLTPPSLYVRRVVGRLAGRHATGPSELVVEGSEGEPSEQHVFRVRTATGGGAQARRLTTAPGWHVAAVGGDVLVIGAQSLEHAGTQWTVRRGDTEVARLESVAAAAPYAPRPVLERVTDRQLPTAVLYPRQHVAGRRLPVLLDVFGGPGRQEVLAVRAAWVERQWWADAGFAVVTVDNRGTPGVGPGFEKVVHRRLADVILTDQVDALTALAGKHPDLDLDRVAVRGHGLGGWLAGLAVLRRPDLFACAVAHTPVTDWTLLDTAFAERYLGLPDEGAAGGEVYAHHSLIELAGEDPGRSGAARPLLLVHGLTDTTVLAAHTVRLSAALLSAARPHAVLPLTGDDPAPAGLLRLELDFVRRHLPWVHPVGGGALPGAP
jgi:dipeptidyl-peptidase-4